MKKFRTILAVALVLCLMAGLMPMAAFADDVNIEENAGDAGSAVSEAIENPAADIADAVAESVGSPGGDTGSGNADSGNADGGANAASAGSEETGSAGAQTAGSSAGEAGSGSGETGSANTSSAGSGDAGAADSNAANSNATDNAAAVKSAAIRSSAAGSGADGNAADNGTADNNAADNAEDTASEESASDSGLPQAPDAFTGNAPEAPVAPAEPDLTGLSDEAANEKIRIYNEEVARYNEAVEQYNAEYDAYEAAAAKYNASVESFNESAASYNAKADEHNQAEQKKLDDYYAAMEDYNQKAGPIIERQQKIDAISEINLAKGKEQRDSLGDINRLDKEKILSLGNVLEEDYVTGYGWRTITLGHAGDLVISWEALKPQNDHSTIQVQDGVKSNETYKVANLHIFEDFANFNERDDYMSERGWDCMNINVDDANGVIIIPKALIDHIAMIEIDVAEVDKNDTVTVLGQNNLFMYSEQAITLVGRYFDNYSDGPYWFSAGSVFQSTAVDSESDWTGTAHTFSYSEGTTDRDDIKNPLNVNHYVFQRYGNKPLPEKPEEVTVDMMDKAESLSFIQILGAKLSRLLGLPEREIKPKEDSAPVVSVDPEVPVIPEVVEIPDEVTPLAVPEQKPEEASEIQTLVSIAGEKVDGQLSTLVHYEFTEEEIADSETPLASGASWALVNLIASLVTVLLTLVCLVNRREKETESDEKETRVRLSVVIPAAVSVILFILTEDMRNPMVMVDIWTPLMLLILAGGSMLDLYVARRDRQENRSRAEIS